ncbi:A/G-specific adenine glycosylase [Paludisphaera mucosa]|uniref:Adenine DNA glycosylase n=1 Tax=Paludisphaera mucosa TaxID=3030827 RepID=A0ABT6F739_9BACT|nr:A/G-specific adenine glycosylase [Paludisphaera mucosa]MDG3003408.1 A/G-specific adenine glycosylase [Paludisphaera mucosa]
MIRERLLDWFDSEKRSLPWRTDRDPYRILVSEMMLVQTTVAAVVPFFERFLDAFPDFASLAAANEDRVLKAWEGLGYYRRARQLHAAAKTIVVQHGGMMPDDADAVRALPGVGRYMAGAILSQAFDRPEPIVEANSRRVLARLLACTDDLTSRDAQGRLWNAAARLVPPRQAGDFNQAMMELGALVCSPRTPRCLICPLAAICEARRLGVQDQIPRATPKAAPLAVVEACAVVACGRRLLLVRRGSPGLWSGFWEFPTIHLEGPDPAGRSFGVPVGLEEGVKRLAGVPITAVGLIRSLTYGVTRYRVRLDAFAAAPRSKKSRAKPKPGPGMSEAAWVEATQLGDLTLSAAGRRLAAAILAEPASWGRSPG